MINFARRKVPPPVTVWLATILSLALFLSGWVIFPSLERSREVSQAFYFHRVGAIIALYTVACGAFFVPFSTVRLNTLDVAVFAYGAYTIVSILANPLLPWYSEHTLTMLLLLGTYLFFRTFLGNPTFLRNALVILLSVVAAQSVFGLLQWTGHLPSWHNTFRVTGTFFNPAPYAGFLVSALPMALGAAWSPTSLSGQRPGRTKLRRWRYGAVAAVMVLAIVASESRAAGLAALVSAGILLGHRLGGLSRWRAAFRRPTMKVIAAALVLLLVGGVATALFYVRPASALGRLLTWKISGQIIRDHPFFGVGYDQFFARFGQYQAAYFARFPDDPLSSLAGQGEYAFNMFIETAVEQGVMGLGLLISVLVIALRTAFRSQNTLTVAAGASIVAVIVFGFFSYPLTIVPIQINLFFLLAWLSTQQSAFVRWPLSGSLTRYALIPGSVVLLIYLGYRDAERYRAYRHWKVASKHKDLFNYQEAIAVYDQVYPVLQDNGKFLFQYGQTLSYEGEHRRATVVLEKARQRTTDTYLYTALGDSYQALEQYQEAEKHYQFAIHHNPYRFYPRYLLAQLYQATHETDQAVAVAEEILAMKIKVPSPRVEKIRKEMRVFVEEHHP